MSGVMGTLGSQGAQQFCTQKIQKLDCDHSQLSSLLLILIEDEELRGVEKMKLRCIEMERPSASHCILVRGSQSPSRVYLGFAHVVSAQ